ncbi:MAG: transporter substrate-binding domain-containing protein [Bacillota bacterium]|nr:transporter substrate-binding domain-containing protein [Bacillota bacterium]MDW7684508.1 transporter substrate-binding domain-containing protein [Bacillota bacterium]
MIKKRSLLLFIILLSVFALALVGCGTADAPEPDGNDNNNAGDEALGDGSVDRVLAAGAFSAAGSGGYPPFNFYEGDNVVGFDVDTGEAIAERLGVELDYITTAWDGIIEGLRARRYDAVLGSMAITDERLQVVNFTVPYYYSGAQLVVLEDSGITDPADMDGKTIGVVTGTTFAEDAETLGAEVALYEDDNQTLLELLNGRVDGVITDRLVAVRAMGEMQQGDRLALAGDLLRTEEMALAIHKDDTELLERLNEILLEMHADGTLTGISEAWFGEGIDITVE